MISTLQGVCVLGAGRIGASIAKLLCRSGSYRVRLVDHDPQVLKLISEQCRAADPPLENLEIRQLAELNASSLTICLQDQQAVVSALPFNLNLGVAETAHRLGCSYFDLTEDVATTKAIEALALSCKEGQVMMPQCGLAPGFVGILAHELSQAFETLYSLKLRVGALPEFPSNQLMYNLTWSTAGLINEYCNSCNAIAHGERVKLEALEGLESFSLDGVEYEAFNTSGGLGTLCRTLDGKVQDLSYKTVRYPGHRYLLDFLINGLRLGEAGERREMLTRILESSIAVTQQDLVLIMVSATGRINGQLTQITELRKIYHQEIDGEHWGAIQISTAASVCAIIDLFFSGKLPKQGFVCQEAVNLADFMQSPFAWPYMKKD